MKNVRYYVLHKDEQQNFDPVAFTEHLKAAGFKFDHEGCPVKITKPWDQQTVDGAVFFRQWDE